MQEVDRRICRSREEGVAPNPDEEVPARGRAAQRPKPVNRGGSSAEEVDALVVTDVQALKAATRPAHRSGPFDRPKSWRRQFRLWSAWRGCLRRRLPGVTPNWRRKAEMKWLTWE